MKSNSDLRHARSLSDLGHKKAFDFKVGYNNRKHIPPINTNRNPQKAIVVTMYRNGDAYFPGAKVSFRPGKDFYPSFYDNLSQRLKIPEGVRHIFTLNGRLVSSMDKLEDGGAYVAAGTKAFKDIEYGKLARLKTGPIRPNAAPLRPDDMLLYKPSDSDRVPKPSPLPKESAVSPDGGISLPGSKESCVVTVVNKKEPAKRSRVLLNLKTRQGWEDVIKDMGQAIGMKNRASRMITPWGEEVRSFSHLKNDFGDVETFYLDGDSGERPEPRRAKSHPDLKGMTENRYDNLMRGEEWNKKKSQPKNKDRRTLTH